MSGIHSGANPFFKHDMDKLCIVCNLKFPKNQTPHSIFDELSEIQPRIKVFDALELISNFTGSNLHNGPQKICQFCYQNTSSAVRFRAMCNKSFDFLESYIQHQEEMKTILKVETISNETAVEMPISSESETPIKAEVPSIEQKTIEPTIDSTETCEKQVTATGVTKIKCKYCHKYYRDTYIVVHRRLHTGEKPYKCSLCDKRFKHATELKKHTVSHTDIRDYLCNVCGKSFKLQSALYSHSKIHTGERKHECQICGKKFREKKMLRDHYSVHSNEKPFTCEVCGKCFPAKKYLRQHMISHAEVKRHECHLCGNRFTQAHSLRTHLSKHCKGGS